MAKHGKRRQLKYAIIESAPEQPNVNASDSVCLTNQL